MQYIKLLQKATRIKKFFQLNTTHAVWRDFTTMSPNSIMIGTHRPNKVKGWSMITNSRNLTKPIFQIP